jgi:hypothetical protein
MRQYRTDYRLWAVVSVPFFVALGFFNPTGEAGDTSLWFHLRKLASGDHRNTGGLVVGIVVQALILAVPAAVAGWLAHAVAVLCGVRLSGRADPDQAADYGDAPPPPTG